MDQNPIRYQTVRLIGKLLHPLTESNLITIPEYREIIAQLKHLADKGTPLPAVIPKLADQTEAATMLGISLANFKRLGGQNLDAARQVGQAALYGERNGQTGDA